MIAKNCSHDENGHIISEIYAVNTDGVFMTNPKYQYPNKKDVKFEVSNIGKTFETDSPAIYFEKHYRTTFQIIIQIKREIEQFIMVVQDVAKLTNSVKWHLRPQIQ